MMEKKIEDYLHFYLGCKYSWKSIDGKSGGKGKILSPATLFKVHNKDIIVSPHLRPLSSITLEEQLIADEVHDKDSSISPMEAKLPFYLLSKHFDLFGLIEAGVALAAPTPAGEKGGEGV